MLQVTVILSGNEAEKFVDSNHPVVAIKKGYVSEFLGEARIFADSLRVNPDIGEAGILREWFNARQNTS